LGKFNHGTVITVVTIIETEDMLSPFQMTVMHKDRLLTVRRDILKDIVDLTRAAKAD
jgi:hypothetical protein